MGDTFVDGVSCLVEFVVETEVNFPVLCPVRDPWYVLVIEFGVFEVVQVDLIESSFYVCRYQGDVVSFLSSFVSPGIEGQGGVLDAPPFS